jgi:2'-5' RNA ligase
MAEKFLCVMVGFDQETEERLAGIQNALYEAGFVGTQTKGLPLHITLGTFPVVEESEVARLVARVAQQFGPFNITFSNIGLFAGCKVLFIAPAPNRTLSDLKDNFGQRATWTPHTTMLIDEPRKVHAALPIVGEQFKSFQGKVQNLHLYEFWPTRHILSLNLGRKE